MSNKFQFIQTFLENEKLNSSQKERFLKLVSKELKKSSESDAQVLEEIRLIKKKLDIETPLYDKKEPSLDLTLKELLNEDDLKKIKNKKNLSFKDQVIKSKLEGNKQDFEVNENVTDFVTKYDWVPSYVNPAGIYKYLLDYNNNLILKSTCHKIDSNELKIINEHCGVEIYDFNKHLLIINEAFEIHDKKYAPAFIKSFIRLYLTGKDFYGNEIGAIVKGKKLGWTEDTIEFSWSNEELKKWAEKNVTMPPCPSEGLARKHKNLGFEFEGTIENSYKRNISTFSKLIIHFKKMFHIKSDNALRNLIIQQNEIKEWNDKIEFIINEEDFPLNIELFTYVERVVQAYNKIIELALEKATGKPKIKLTFQEDEKVVEFKIHHLNNRFSKSNIGIKERLHGQVYKNIIINQINGLCDLFVHADLDQNNFFRFNVWDENYNKKELSKNPLSIVTSNTPIHGVIHILRFKKK
ncbi:hypothetical protein [Polaribacter sp. Hel_I_88]|uniref:hypothetical protein n=1 Tax=Polaribacter sp. Hel_I_88 TaxID=1250006 RepID=UPI00047BEE9F|nr:hypothetical protein [Polaribacter sp. Hel_I_88]